MKTHLSNEWVDYSITHPDHVYEELEISELSKCYQSQLARIREKDPIDQWVSQKVEKWEERIFGSTAGARRLAFVSMMKAQSFHQVLKTDHCRRWELGYFDSVTVKELVMGTIYVTVPEGAIVGEGRRGYFRHDLGWFNENDCTGRFAHVGRDSLTYHKLMSLSWTGNVDVDNSVLAVRSKIDGSRFVKRIVGDQAYLSGFIDILVPANFPVEVAEYYAGDFYIIYPYGLRLDKDRWDIYTFKEHPWSLPSNYVPMLGADGIMLLTSRCEYRVKRNMMVDLKVQKGHVMGVPTHVSDGVWEFQVVMLEGGRMYFPVRPRPGKVPKVNCRHLYSEILSPHLVLPEAVSHRLIVISSGAYSGPLTMRKSCVLIDSGCRPAAGSMSWVPINQTDNAILTYSAGRFEIEEVLESGGVYWYSVRDKQSQERRTVRTLTRASASWYTYDDLPDNIIGGKAVVPLDDGSVFLFNDEGKLLDFPGGSLEYGETPLEGTNRELREEMGLDDPGPMFPICCSSAVKLVGTRKREFHSFMYLLLPRRRDELTRFKGTYVPWGGVAPEHSQDWVARCLQAVWDVIPSVRAMKLVHAYMLEERMDTSLLTEKDRKSPKIRQLETFVVGQRVDQYLEDIVLSLIESHEGMSTEALLDVGLGTGKNFRPVLLSLLSRGLAESVGGSLTSRRKK
jgi:ADP-ribose pyrophosphatase YjhB (NUDIX family)